MTVAAQRLDTTLVRRGLARSRTHAARLIAEQRVTVPGRRRLKPASPIDPDEPIAVTPPPVTDATDAVPMTATTAWASRGGVKLAGALEVFAVDPADRVALDAGASTGGFTDVLLRHGARRVLALDVGHDQLLPALREDPRVIARDGVNVRHLQVGDVLADLGERPGIIVVDLSFISLRLVLPALLGCAAPDADVVALVKPQFEVGRGRLGAGGVVHDPQLRARAVVGVAAVAAQAGWGTRAVAVSPLPGPAGTIEYFLHLRADEPVDPQRTHDLIDRQVASPPQTPQPPRTPRPRDVP